MSRGGKALDHAAVMQPAHLLAVAIAHVEHTLVGAAALHAHRDGKGTFRCESCVPCAADIRL